MAGATTKTPDDGKSSKEKKDEKTTTTTATTTPKRKHRKDMPSVAYMLKHGNPETAHLPKTAMQKYGYPIALAIVFAISLLIFHYAPHEKSVHHNKVKKPFQQVLNTDSSKAGRYNIQQQRKPIDVVKEDEKPKKAEEGEL